MSIRSEKVASVIKRELAEPISQIGSEATGGLITLTAVRVTTDLQIANLYVSVFGTKASPGEALGELELRQGELKDVIAKNLRLRFIPELRFFLDDTLDRMEHIQDLLDSVKKEDEDNNQDK